MGLFSSLLLSIVHLMLLAIDILSFFILVRLLCYGWHAGWLKALDTTGKPVVDWFIDYVQRIATHLTTTKYSQRAQLAAGMLVLVLIRSLLVALFGK